MELVQGLNPQQQQAVMAGLGPVLVVAGPGSGKTRVLTHRIAYLIGSLGVQPYNILAVTFTNKAAKEMGLRVATLLGGEQQGRGGMPQVGTFHSFCARVLRREAEHLPFNANFVIFDADDQVTLVKHALADLNIDEKRYRAQGVHASISNAKNELILPDNYPTETYRDEVVKRVYARYQEMLLANNALDFDDLLLWTAALLEQNEAVRTRYSRRFEHVLVDEFQDTNLAQYALLKQLASFHRNLYVVGDTDQSIYAWRGADYRNLLRFEQDFPDSQVILLEQNYRSTQYILDVATAVIEKNPQRKRKRLFTDRGAGLKALLRESPDERSEAAFVLDTIGRLVAGKQAKPGEIAVMYRTNAQSRTLEEAFLRARQPYKLVGAQRFYGRREVKDVMAYLRLAYNPSDEVSLTRVINTPTRGIGDKTIQTLRILAAKAGISPGALVLSLGGTIPENSPARADLNARALAALHAFGLALNEWHALAAGQQAAVSPLALLDRILAEVNYRAYIDDGTDEGNDRWENVMELRRLAAEFNQRTVGEFLEEITLVSDQDTMDANASVPTLLTLHAAKGLEFRVVFIVGLTDGNLPHSRSFDDPDSMQEERRLLYVGVTRAMDRLYLLYPQSRSAYGYNEPCDPSRFLQDIPRHLLEISGEGRAYYPSERSVVSKPIEAWQPVRTTHSPAKPPAAPSGGSEIPNRELPNRGGAAGAVQRAQRYPAGTKVVHPVWGDGMVLNSKLENDDEIVDVFFEGVGLKKVAASLAKLQIKSDL